MYRHVCTLIYLYVHGIDMYIHSTDMIYRHGLHSCTGTNMFVHGTEISVPFCQIQIYLYRFAKSCPGGQDSIWAADAAGSILRLLRPARSHH